MSVRLADVIDVLDQASKARKRTKTFSLVVTV